MRLHGLGATSSSARVLNARLPRAAMQFDLTDEETYAKLLADTFERTVNTTISGWPGSRRRKRGYVADRGLRVIETTERK
jgi:hypothetical protein